MTEDKSIKAYTCKDCQNIKDRTEEWCESHCSQYPEERIKDDCFQLKDELCE